MLLYNLTSFYSVLTSVCSVVYADQGVGVPRDDDRARHSSRHHLGVHVRNARVLQQLVLHARYVDA